MTVEGAADVLLLQATALLPPGATVPLQLTMLSSDDAGLWCVVRYPPGWERPQRGWYDVDEELLVLDGAVVAGGTTFQTGDYSYRPARLVRPTASSPLGALAVVLAHGRPAFTPAEHEPGGGDRSAEVWHRPLAEVPVETTADGVRRRRLSASLVVHDLPPGWSGRLPDGEVLVLSGSVTATHVAEPLTLPPWWYARAHACSARAVTGCQLLVRSQR